MEFKINNLDEINTGSISQSSGNGKIIATINGKQHSIQIISLKNSIIEFILDNSYKTAKILEYCSANFKILIDGEEIDIKKHSKLTEVLEKSTALGGASLGENKLLS